MLKHYTIPIFVPEEACPNQCVFCNQKKISGQQHIPTILEAKEIIESYLKTISRENTYIQIGFFGGNFTGIEIERQRDFLSLAKQYLDARAVDNIRISTRPDYINEEIIALLKEYKVGIVELGAQSLNDEVLLASGRGHSVEDVEKASQMIVDAGIELGLQMMIGLPKDSKEKSMATAKKIIELGAKNTRIYPTLVIKGTQLHAMYEAGKYKALSIEEAVDWCKDIYPLFEINNVNVIRLGLHASDTFTDGSDLVVGPFHISFRELVYAAIWKDIFLQDEILRKQNNELDLSIKVHPSQLNYVIGYKKSNRIWLQQNHKSIHFMSDESMGKYDYKLEVLC